MDLITVRVVGILLGLSICMIRPIEQTDNNIILRNQLQNAAQKALDAIGSKAKLSASEIRARKGQHVFNNGLLKFHDKVLEDLLKDLLRNRNEIYDESLEFLKQRLDIPLNTTVRDAINSTVVHFSKEEFYVDYNAFVYGEYVKQLREKIVELLKTATALHAYERNEAGNIRERVVLIASKMVEHDVYVDPMARDRWLQENSNNQQRQQLYNQVRDELQKMFLNILQNFLEVAESIKHFRRTNTWNR